MLIALGFVFMASAAAAAPAAVASHSLPAEVVAWERGRGWNEHHARWHAQRRWDLLSAPTRLWAQARGWAPAARMEGAPGSGREFLLMHRAMLRLLRARFADRAELFRGWESPPAALLDARMTAAVARLTLHLESFPTEDALGRYIETDLRPRPGAPGALSRDATAGVHTRLHEKLSDEKDPVDAGDPTVNIENRAFWELHGWIDGRWAEYRRLRGLDDDARSYQDELSQATTHMDHEGAPPLDEPVPDEIGKAFFRNDAAR